MPKIVSFRNNIFTNTNRILTDERFRVFRCRKCSSHCIITDVPHSVELPERRTDSASVLDASKYIVKLTTNIEKDAKKLYREKGVENQYHHHCKICDSFIAYQCVPSTQELRFLYIVKGAVTFPAAVKRSEWHCTVCGYFAKDKQSFEHHKVQRGHQRQEEGNFKPAESDAIDSPVPPMIVG